MIGDARLPDEPRRPRWGRRIAAAAVLLALVSPWWAPPILHRMDFFDVRQVEVRGGRYTPADEIRALLAIDTTFSIWNPLDSLQARVATHPQLSHVTISRRLPATLVVRVEEHEPVALVPGGNGLRAYDATGRALPLDPSRTPVDVPIVPLADTALFRLLGDVRQSARDVFARVSEVRRVARDVVALDLVDFTVLVAPGIGVERLHQISSVEAELASRRVRLRELDFRYRDQVIARLQ